MTSFDLRNVRKLIREFKLPLSGIGEEDLYRQFVSCWQTFDNKTALFLGDSNYLALLLSHFCQTRATILDSDEMAIKKLNVWKHKLNLINLKVIEGVVIKTEVEMPFVDTFCLSFLKYPDDFNFKMKLLLSLGIRYLKIKGEGLIILPKLDLTRNLASLIEMQAFLTSNNTAIVNFDSDVKNRGRFEDIGKNFLHILVCCNGEADNLIIRDFVR